MDLRLFLWQWIGVNSQNIILKDINLNLDSQVCPYMVTHLSICGHFP